MTSIGMITISLSFIIGVLYRSNHSLRFRLSIKEKTNDS